MVEDPGYRLIGLRLGEGTVRCSEPESVGDATVSFGFPTPPEEVECDEALQESAPLLPDRPLDRSGWELIWYDEGEVPLDRGICGDRVVYWDPRDRKSTRLNSSHVAISYAVFCFKKKKINSN